MDEDLLARINILIFNSLNLAERVEQMMENRCMCGDAEEQSNTEEEQVEDVDVDEGGDVRDSEGWRTPPECLVSASIITRVIFF